MSRSNALWMECYERLCADFEYKRIIEHEFRRRMDALGFCRDEIDEHVNVAHELAAPYRKVEGIADTKVEIAAALETMRSATR